MSDLFKAERDTIAGLGLLAANYVRFDPALKVGNETSHARGFNVQCLVVDNVDGEVLAIEQNRIHADHNPLQHAEQLGIRGAMARLHIKRPRPGNLSVEKYYKQKLFMAPGSNPPDYINVGCTLYNTFDPCGYCAVTLLVCYMKRIAYLFDDKKFDGVYEQMRTYFKNRESIKEPLSLVNPAPKTPTPLHVGGQLIAELRETVKQMEEAGTPLVMTMDACHEQLGRATQLFMEIQPEHLQTTDLELARNLRTIEDIRRLCNLQ